MGWSLVALRRIRSDLAPTLGLALLVLVTALVAALAPRVLAVLADDAVHGEIAAAPAAARNIVLLSNLVAGDGTPQDPLAGAHAEGETRLDTFPAPVTRLISSTDVLVESGRFRLQKATTDPAFIRFRIHEGIDRHIRYVEGRAPTVTVERRDDIGPEAIDRVPVYETGVSVATAKGYGLSVGDEVTLIGDPGDPLLGRTPQDVYAFARITGIYEVPDPASGYWLDDPLPIHYVIRALSSEVQLLDAVLIVDPGTHPELAADARSIGRDLRYTWRSFLDTDAVRARAVPGLVTAFRRLEVKYPSANITAGSDTAMRTSMLELLTGFEAAWASAVSILAVTAVGPALVAVATLELIALLAGRRRRATMGLVRVRGASGVQVLWPALVEGLLVSVPVAALATTIALAAVDGGRALPAVVMGGIVVLVAAAVVVGTVIPVVRTLGPERRPGARAAGRIGGRRLLLEGLVVVLAAAAAVLLRQRGIGAAGVTGEIAGFDPLIAAVPALVGVAAGIIAVRLYPLPMGLAARMARRGRGLIGMLAARRATEGGASAVLLVLLATSTVGAFAAVSLDNLDRGADLAAWQEVGAAYRLEQPAGALPAGFDPAGIPGVEAAAGEFRANIPLGLSGPQTLFVAVEAGNLERALAGTPVAPVYPPGFTTPGTGPIPAIISRAVADSPRGVTLGETFTMSVEGYALTYRADLVVEGWPGLPAGRGFVIAPREWFLAQAPAARIMPVVARVRAAPGSAEAIRAAVAGQAPTVLVASQAEDAAERRSAPVTGSVRSLVLVAALVTAAYAALGVAAALALAGLARTQEVAHLRTLGLTSRGALALLVAEHGPLTFAAFATGGLLGAGLFALLRPALGLGALVGAPVEVPVVLEPAVLVLILVLMAAVVTFGLLLGAALQRRVAPTDALRGRSE
jgi:putative ABC transport system permease protein